VFRCPLRARSGAPVQRLVLEMPDGFDFHAGQYLEVVHHDGRIPLSIASGPRRLPELHLHYRSTPGACEAEWMDELLATDGPLTISGPSGDVWLPEQHHELPLLLIAGGTGIAQVCGILDELADIETRAPVTLLWCVDAAADLYCRTDLAALEQDWLHCEYLVDARRDAANAGLARIAVAAAAAAHPREPLAPAEWVLLAGSPGFVYAACDTMTSAGLDAARIHSDVFAYAPRPVR